MAQDWPSILSNEKLKDTRTEITGRDESLKSNFSGTSFPVTDVVVGMHCYRTDQNKMYQLRSTGPDVWVIVADLDETYLSQELAAALFSAISHAHSGAEIVSGTVAAARLPAEIQLIKVLTAGAMGVAQGSIDVDGYSNSYSGLHFSHASVLRKLLVSATLQGVMRANDGVWQWQWNNGQLTVGDVPWGRLSSIPGMAVGARTVSTSAPSGGVDGDVWMRY